MSLNTPQSPARPRRRLPPLLVVGIAVALAAASLGYAFVSGDLFPSSQGPLHVVDDYGRNVSVSAPPTRIVVLIASAMDIVYDLGLRPLVVGVDCAAGDVYGDYTPGQVANWSLSSLPCVSALPFSKASVLALHPQLVVAGPGISVADLDELASAGVPALGLNPSNLTGILHDVTLVGALTGRSSEASALDATLNASLAQDASALAAVSGRPSVLLTYYADSTGYYTFGPGSFGNSLIERAGGVSITANDSEANSGEVSGSYVLEADPSIILAGTGFGIGVANYTVGPYWNELSAVKDGQVFGVAATLLTEPGPSMILGIPQLLADLHPGI